MRKISNEEFNEAYTNIDNLKIINKVKKKYRKRIPKDELDSCGLDALWCALQKYDGNKKNKFTSFLYKMVNWKCSSWIIKDNKNKYNQLPTIAYEHKFFDEFYDYISVLPNELSDLVERRIIQNMSTSKIGKEKNLKSDEVKVKINKAYNILRSHVNRTILR